MQFVEARPKDLNNVRQVAAVMSGKGGVGKSLVTGLLAVSLARLGRQVGILDADITGPSIARMFGIDQRPIGSETGFMPVPSRTGIEVMSINLLLPCEDDAIIWRGPLIGRAIQQFWEDVLWGKLDFLIVDLPPGTSDAPLTVIQSLPLSGVIIVFSPQELATMVVRKAVKMVSGAMKVPILGVVENMSYLVLPDTGKRLCLFGESKGEEMSKVARSPLLCRIPVDPQLAHLCDDGDIEHYNGKAMDELAEGFLRSVASVAAQAGEHEGAPSSQVTGQPL